MLRKLQRQCKPTSLLLIVGFTISLTAVLVGISTVNTLLEELSDADGRSPIVQTMQNTGLTLALSVYLFSVVNGFVVSNYWIVTKRREFAIRKAFGWTNRQLIGLLGREMAGILMVSLCISGVLLRLAAKAGRRILCVRITPLFMAETCLLLGITLILSMIVPARNILGIQPAEVIS